MSYKGLETFTNKQKSMQFSEKEKDSLDMCMSKEEHLIEQPIDYRVDNQTKSSSYPENPS